MSKTVLITGATSGIGYASATLFLQKGWIVYATGRNKKSLDKLSDLGAISLTMDVTDSESIHSAYKIIQSNSHTIDVLINNAGYGQFGTFEEVSDSDARKQFDTNVFGLASVTKLFLPLMRSKGSGRIINVSSIAGEISIPAGGWYAASKHAVEALSDALRWEVKPFGIKVCVIQPGPIRTNFSNTVEKNKSKNSTESAYGSILEKVTSTGAKSPGATPESCAKKIFRAATAKRPKNRYIITKEAYLIKIILHLFPSKLIDYFIVRAVRSK